MSDIDWHRTSVTATDGVELAVFTTGLASGTTILLVHGYPDDHCIWNSVAQALQADFRLIGYDVRGAGASGAPDERSGYRLAQLVSDLETVAATADGPVHLLAHDWGSIQAWQAVTRAGAQARFGSLTSISGPALPYSSTWYRATWRTDKAAVLRQARASWYVPVFLLPAAPELAWRAGILPHLLAGRRRDQNRLQSRSRANGVHGLELYRANVRSPAIGAARRCAVPAQVIAPRRDPFITVAYALQAPAPWAEQLRTHVVDGGHWTFVGHPQRVVEPVREFVAQVGARSARA